LISDYPAFSGIKTARKANAINRKSAIGLAECGWQALLVAMQAAVAQARARGDACVDAAARAANPPSERQPGQQGRLQPSPARNLLARLWKEHEAVLGIWASWTTSPSPATTTKRSRTGACRTVQQTIAGPFRVETGAEAFARLRGYLSSLRQQGVGLLAAWQSVFRGQPLYPALG
jgi:transposase